MENMNMEEMQKYMAEMQKQMEAKKKEMQQMQENMKMKKEEEENKELNEYLEKEMQKYNEMNEEEKNEYFKELLKVMFKKNKKSETNKQNATKANRKEKQYFCGECVEGKMQNKCRALKYSTNTRLIQCNCEIENGEMFCNKHLKEIKSNGFIRNGIYGLYGGWWNNEKCKETYPERHINFLKTFYGEGATENMWNEEEKQQIMQYMNIENAEKVEEEEKEENEIVEEVKEEEKTKKKARKKKENAK
jgi:hypothetical protein